jgi:hypothetical protein
MPDRNYPSERLFSNSSFNLSQFGPELRDLLKKEVQRWEGFIQVKGVKIQKKLVLLV